MAIKDDALLELFKKMILTRKMEEKHQALLFKEKAKIAFGHWSTGQEAVGIGATAALKKEDVMIGSHRGFVEYIGKGMDPVDIWAEYLGKKNVLNGKAGIQVSDKRNNIPGMTSAIGGCYALAVGIAYALKMRGEDRLVWVSYGDGGYNQSDTHPAMIMASSLKLPLIFHVPYNGWAEYTRSEEFNPTKSVAARGVAYNIPAFSVDGQRIEVVYEAAKKAVEHVRSGKGPYITEYMTRRLANHFSGDQGGYIDEDERREWAKRDPIKLCREMLIKKGVISETDFKRIDAEMEHVMQNALKQAMALPDPDVNDLYSNVYASIDWNNKI
jgi:TPP-dependent pyruvate/acetoin dehydrogenase alpha subunit